MNDSAMGMVHCTQKVLIPYLGVICHGLRIHKLHQNQNVKKSNQLAKRHVTDWLLL